jgi:hypothetical protein
MIGIGVICANRKNYLHIALDSIFKAHHSNSCLVGVYIDAPLDCDVKSNLFEIISDFPVERIHLERENRLLVKMSINAYDDLFDQGCERVMMIHDDTFISRDAIEYIENLENITTINTLFKCAELPEEVNYVIGHSSGVGVTFFKDSYLLIRNLVVSNAYSGIEWTDSVPYCKTPKVQKHAWDAILDHIANQYKFSCSLPPVSKMAHIGVRTASDNGTSVDVEIENKLFAGSKLKWLDNAIEVMKGGLF